MTVTAPASTASPVTVAATIAVRTTFKILRTPQIVGIAIVQSVMFLLMFRYVLGGAIGVPGVAYVDFLVPGFVVSGILFTGGGSAVAVAEDAASGLYDRLRSLPISDTAVLVGRTIADAALMVLVGLVTFGVGFLVGFSVHGSALDVLFAIGLLVVYALGFAGVFVWIGLVSGATAGRPGVEHPRRAVLVRVERVRADQHDARRARDVRGVAAADVHGELVAWAAPGRCRDRDLRAQPRVLHHRLTRVVRRARGPRRPAGVEDLPQTLISRRAPRTWCRRTRSARCRGRRRQHRLRGTRC